MAPHRSLSSQAVVSPRLLESEVNRLSKLLCLFTILMALSLVAMVGSPSLDTKMLLCRGIREYIYLIADDVFPHVFFYN